MDVRIKLFKRLNVKNSIILLTVVLYVIFGCSDIEETNLNSNSNQEETGEWECGTHNGNTLYTGPRGGCYYYNSNKNKTYVDRKECDC